MTIRPPEDFNSPEGIAWLVSRAVTALVARRRPPSRERHGDAFDRRHFPNDRRFQEGKKPASKRFRYECPSRHVLVKHAKGG